MWELLQSASDNQLAVIGSTGALALSWVAMQVGFYIGHGRATSRTRTSRAALPKVGRLREQLSRDRIAGAGLR